MHKSVANVQRWKNPTNSIVTQSEIGVIYE
jgi:hypothetical protein